MRAGRLRHECSVMSYQQTSDGMGGGESDWIELRKLRAEITMPTGRTAVVAQQIEAQISAEIRCRPSPGLIAGLRLVHGSIVYLIEASLLDNDRTMLRLLCSVVPASQLKAGG